MKRNITLAIDAGLLKRARSLAAARGASISALLAEELQKLVSTDAEYQKARNRALARLDSPFHLGGEGIRDRDSLHDRKSLR